MKSKTSGGTIGIIGLGRFGMSLAIELATSGKKIVCIDKDEKKIKEVLNYCEFAYVTDDLSLKTLEETGFKECDTIVICIGEQIDTSILTTLNCKELGVRKVIAKATSEEQGKVLEKLGAEVIYPEKDSADHLAKRILSNNIVDFLSLNEDIDIVEIKVPSSLVGISVKDCRIRDKYGLNIIAIEGESKLSTKVSPSYIFKETDKIVLIGNKADIMKLENGKK
jgi:trk system potassium uptake protein TrkA